MGSGCTSSTNTGTSPSFSSIPDKTVKYTGPAIPSLGICTNDTLFEVETVILDEIVLFAQGKGINITDIDLTKCDCFKTKIGCCGASSCQSLICILQAYLECMCELYADVQVLTTKVDAMYDGPYNTGCLTGVTSASKLPAIIQAITTDFCVLKTQVANLTTIVNNLTTTLPTTIGNFLDNAIKSCQTGSMVKTGSGASIQISFKGFAPVGAVMAYAGSLAYFDSSGLGTPNSPVCGWALCNGSNGTVNMIGLAPVGSTDMPGPQVITGATFPFNSTGGQYSVTLTGAMCSIPSHTHPVIDPGHSHVMHFSGDTFSGTKFSNMVKFDGNNLSTTLDPDPDIGNIHIKIMRNTTGISIGPSSGGGGGSASPHENRMPYRALHFIQRIA